MTESLAELEALDRAALVERWRTVFGQPAPRYTHLELLRSALAWEVQRQAAGMKPSARHKIVRALGKSPRARRLAPGSELLRDWKGRTHRVSVLAKSFEYDGHSYRSLSAVARAITGTAWSGSRFFGLPE
jgi:hypothetical protein